MKRTINRGQTGETLTWVVATIIIILILVISFVIVEFSFSNRQMVKYLSNDVIVTKSAIAFFNEDDNFDILKDSINNDNYDLIKPRVEKFLGGISSDNEQDFRVLVDGKLQDNSVVQNNFHGLANNRRSFFEFNLDGKKIILRFYGGQNEQ